MLIDAPTVVGTRVSTTVAMANGAQAALHWELPYAPVRGCADALLPAALPVAMRMGEPLTVRPAVSPRMLDAAESIQDILACWGALEGMEAGLPPLFRRVPLEVTAAPESPPGGEGVACFFTAGVDSFYSVLKHRPELTALVYVHGFDVPLEEIALREKVTAGVRAAAASIGLPLVEVESDVRAFSDPLVPWQDYHGAALASVALLLGDQFQRVYIPATMTYATLLPLGSHPMVDPLWSSERLEIVHDGSEATRGEKLLAIAGCEAARRWLRVCWENRDGAYNCGRCEKCVRTLVELRLADVSHRFASFPPLDMRDVAQAPLEFGGMGWRAALHTAERAGGDPELAEAIRTSLRRQRHVAADRDGEPRRVSDPRCERLELLTTASVTADERDRLRARVAELEARVAAMQTTRAWRAAARARRARARLGDRLGGGG